MKILLLMVFQTYLKRYNYERPHFGLKLITLIEAIQRYNH